MHNERIKDLFAQVENKVFTGKRKMYELFKRFDKDCDGYISYQDFGDCLNQLKVNASKQEIGAMMKLLDKNSQGYLTFGEFSRIFTPSMSTTLVSLPLNDTYLPNC